MIDVATITWTRFSDRAAGAKREISHEWRELVDHLRHAGPYAAKSVCPWIKLARFGMRRTVKGSLRNNANLIEIVGVEGDYDGEKIQPAEAVRRLEAAGVRAVVYTSPSHRQDSPRWRVLAPLSHPLPPSERTQMLARVNGALGGILTPESFTLSQSYYYGRTVGQDDYQVLVTFDDPDEGACIDELDALDELAVVASGMPEADDDAGIPAAHAIAEAVQALGRPLRTGDNRRVLLRRYIGDRAARGLGSDEVRLLVESMTRQYFDAADPSDWANVNELIEDICGNEARKKAEVRDTVGAFVDSVTVKPQEPQKLILSVSDLAAHAAQFSWAVKHIVPENSVGMIFGASGTFKSFIAIDYALHRTYGLKWMGRKTKPGKVMYLAAEGGVGLLKRIQAWHLVRGLDWTQCAIRVVIMPLTLKTRASMLADQIRASGESFTDIIIDTLSQTYTGNENAADEMADYFRVIGEQLRAQFGVTCIVVHHSGHGASERPRGSSAIIANVDFLIGVFRDEHAMLATVCCIKQKDGSVFDDEQFSLTSVEIGRDEDDEPITSLSASCLTSGAELAASLLREKASGRSSHAQTLHRVARHGMIESELRKAFRDEMPESSSTDTTRRAYNRALDILVKAGVLVIDEAAGRKVHVVQPVDNS